MACNPTRDRRINRAWHSMTGHYNIYFNAETKFLNAMEALEKGHKDDFTRILEVFPYGDEASAKGVGGQMDEVIKKSSQCIQNHMVGSWTDDCYLLLGKAQYFKRDYYAALEPFQYINTKYKTKGLHPIATCWIAKSYMGLKKEGEAEAIMGLLLSEITPRDLRKDSKLPESETSKKQQKVPRYHRAEIYATAADIAIKQGRYAIGAEKLRKALELTSTQQKPTRIRYTYILGQLYLEMDSVKKANQYFSKVLRMLAPYEFEFNASINLARAYDADDKTAAKRVRRSLKRMLRDDKNEGMYDQIWFEMGKLEQKEKNIPAAIKAYRMAAATSTKNQNQKALAYLALGNIYLEQPEYKLAQAYYDSTATSLNKDYRDYQKIIDKKNVLSELIANLVVIDMEDSLQQIAKLDKDQVEKKIDQWIAAAKLAADQKLKDSKARRQAAKDAAANPAQQATTTNINAGFGEAGQWYFYNPGIMAAGATDFFSNRKWGQRANTDFWRISAKEKEAEADQGETAGDREKHEKDSVEAEEKKKDEMKHAVSTDRQAWIANVPFGKDDMQKSEARMMDAYYNIGTIYDEKLNDQKEAAANYESMLLRFSGSSYEPEVLYRLYKIYTAMKQKPKAEEKRNMLITKYPESPYALILQNKSVSSAETDANRQVVEHYENMYALFQQGRYEEVKAKKLEADRKFPGNAIRAKFDLLHALAVGKTEPRENFRSALNFIAKEYAKTDVGDHAQNILNYMKKQDAASSPDTSKVAAGPDFLIEPAGPYYYVLAIKNDKTDFNEIESKMIAYNEEFRQFDNLRANHIVSNDGYQLLMVREFADYDKAAVYLRDIEIVRLVENKLKVEGAYMQFVISANNLKKMLKEQKTESYHKLFREKYKAEAGKQDQQKMSPMTPDMGVPDNPDQIQKP